MLDPARVASGTGSLRLDTNNGQAAVFYPKTRDASFDLSQYLYVSYSITSDTNARERSPGWQGAQPHLLLVRTTPTTTTSTCRRHERLPTHARRLRRRDGAARRRRSGWNRNRIGAPDLTKVHYFALTFDSWGEGFTVWIDNLLIGPGEFVDCGP